MTPGRRQLLLGALLAGAGSLAGLPALAACDDPRPLRFAQVPLKKFDDMLSVYRPLFARLEATLGRPVKVVPLPSYGAVVEGLADGSLDVAELGPAAYAEAKSRLPDLRAFATFSGGAGQYFDFRTGYQSVLIVRAGRGFSHLGQLAGRTLALTDPSSTSGALFPRHYVERETGRALEKYFRRVSFAGSHLRAIEAVQRGDVDAAFVASSQIEAALNKGTLQPGEIALLWQSPPIPFDPFVHRGALCPAVSENLRRAFFDDPAALADLFEALGRRSFIPADDSRYRDIFTLYRTTAGQ